MNASRTATETTKTPLFMSRIVYATDLRPSSEAVFAHALKLALLAKAELRILHVASSDETADIAVLPHSRPLLAKWGVLSGNASEDDVRRLGIQLDKRILHAKRPLLGLEEHFRLDPVDWIVMESHHCKRLCGLREGVSLRLVRDCLTPALLFPAGASGFVNVATGELRLARVLIAAAESPSASGAIRAADRLARLAGVNGAEMRLLRVGADFAPGDLETPKAGRWRIERVARPGDPLTEILREAVERRVDLIAMTTEGRQGVSDELFGSTTERVVRQAPCPVLAVPSRGY